MIFTQGTKISDSKIERSATWFLGLAWAKLSMKMQPIQEN